MQKYVTETVIRSKVHKVKIDISKIIGIDIKILNENEKT